MQPSGAVLVAGGLGGLISVVATLLSLIVRFYFSRGEKRLQLKWFTYALAGVLYILSICRPCGQNLP